MKHFPSVRNAFIIGKLVGWTLGTALFVLLSVEVFFRLGLPMTSRYKNENQYSKDRDKFRVVMLGDSFSEDYDGKEAEYYRNRGLGFLNLAQFGTGPVDYLNRFKYIGVNYHPNVVILNYFVGNDLTDTMSRKDSPLVKRVLRQSAWNKISMGNLLSHFFLPESFYELWFKKFFFLGMDQLRADLAKEETISKKKAVNPYLVKATKWRPGLMKLDLMVEGAKAQNAWKTNRECILKVAKLAKEANAHLLINIFPATAQVNRSHYAFLQELGFEMSDEFLKTSIPQNLILHTCREHQLDCLDVLPNFRALGNKDLYQ